MGNIILIFSIIALGAVIAMFITSIVKRVKGDKFKSTGDLLYKILGVVLVAYVITMISVLVWGLLTTFKNNTLDYNKDNKVGWPKEFVFSNFKTVFGNMEVMVSIPGQGTKYVGALRLFGNSFLYAVGNALCRIAVLFIVAYATARFKFLVGKIIYGIVIVGMILPIVGAQPTMVKVAMQLHLHDTFIGMFIQKANFMGMHFLIMHATLAAFPKDFDEAAQIDGANNLSVMFRIMLPLSMTTISTLLLLNFITEWNDYATPLLFMPTNPTLAYALRRFEDNRVYKYLLDANGNFVLDKIGDPQKARISDTPTKLAACFVAAIPTLTLFLIFHNKLLNNLSIGGVKE